MKTIEFKGRSYPGLQAEGYAAQYAFPFARKFCVGKGYDIGCHKLDWVFDDATPIDLDFKDPWHADHLPEGQVDYIFSSHCLEHVPDWVATLNYWKTKVRSGGIIFMYLPHFDQEYWRPWNNRKHMHVLTKEMLDGYFEDMHFKQWFVTDGYDLNHAFYAVAEV